MCSTQGSVSEKRWGKRHALRYLISLRKKLHFTLRIWPFFIPFPNRPCFFFLLSRWFFWRHTKLTEPSRFWLNLGVLTDRVHHRQIPEGDLWAGWPRDSPALLSQQMGDVVGAQEKSGVWNSRRGRPLRLLWRSFQVSGHYCYNPSILDH